MLLLIISLPAPAMRAQDTHQLSQFMAIGEGNSALEGGDVVGVIEAHGAHRAGTAHRMADIRSAHSLAAIFNHVQAMLISQRAYFVHVTWITIHMHQHYRLCLRRNGSLQFLHIQIVGGEVAIHKYRDKSVLDNRPDSRGPRERRNNHLIASFQTPMPCRVRQCRDGEEIGRGTGIAHHGILHAKIPGALLLKLPHLWPHGYVGRAHLLAGSLYFLLTEGRFVQTNFHILLSSPKIITVFFTDNVPSELDKASIFLFNFLNFSRLMIAALAKRHHIAAIIANITPPCAYLSVKDIITPVCLLI